MAKWTVAICTWNRASLLDRTLQRMRELRVPSGDAWEVVVIDNNCTDETPSVLARHAQALPLRHIVETHQGQSAARNRAAAEATGDWIVWTDDDVLVAPDWLEAYAAALTDYPDAALLGGLIEPWFETEPPPWLRNCWEQVASAYAVVDRGAEPVPLTPWNLPYGANYAVRAAVQKRIPYDVRIGRCKTGQIRGEELDVMVRILETEGPGYWVPSARVQHYIPAERMNLSYVRGFYYGVGQLDILSGRVAPRHRGVAAGMMLARALRMELRRVRWGAQLGPTPRWMEYVIASSRYWGQLRGTLSTKQAA